MSTATPLSSSALAAANEPLPLPVTVNTAALASWWQQLQNHSSAPVREVLNRLRLVGESEYKTLRPWTSFFAYTRMSRPMSVVDLQTRVVSNVVHYRTNYAVFFFVLTFYALISNLLLLASLLLVGGVYSYVRASPAAVIHMGSVQMSRSQFNVAFALGTVILLYVAGFTGTLGWLIGVGSLAIVGHAAFSDPAPPETIQTGEFV